MTALVYNAPPTLRRFMDSSAFIRAVVGPVGGGKSSACIMEILARAAEQKPGPDGVRRTRFAIIRNTYPQLRDTTRKTVEQWFSPLLDAGVATWAEQSFSLTLAFNDLHCEVLFRALDRPQDVKKLLSLELTGAYINEAREVPKDVFEVLQTRVGRYPSKAQGGPTWFGIWMDTNPWHMGHWGYELFSLRKPTGHALFEQPDGLSPDAENVENLPEGYYSRLCEGKDAEWVAEYVRGKYPNRDKGSVYGELLTNLESIGAVGCEFEHPKDGLFVTFDLGVSDATAMWWWRPNPAGGVDFVDYYEAMGRGLGHFIDEARKREEEEGWEYLRLILPHDARHRALTGSTVEEQLEEAYPGKVDVLPLLPLEDGLSSTRWLLERLCRFHARCAPGVKALRAYRYEWDADRLVYSRKPLHDWTSHGADSARYVATYAKRGDLLAKSAARPAPKKPKALHEFTLNDFYAMGKGPAKSGRVA